MEKTRLKYEGDYLNGQRHGKGKEYYNNDALLYEGEYLYEQKYGKGKEYYNSGEIFFEGEYLYDKKWEGKAYDKMNNIIFELHEGKGFVKEFSGDRLQFEGKYLYGERNGKGKDYYYDGSIYECEYINGKRNGKGKEYYPNGELKFEGEYLYDWQVKGKFYINKKLRYEGEYLYDVYWNCKGYDENGNIIFEIKNGNGKSKRILF